MKEKLYIFPYNGNGLEALDCIGDKYEFLGFIDDTPEKQGKNQFGHAIYPRTKLSEFKDTKIIAVPGSPSSYKIRDKIISDLNLTKERFISLIHPKASVSPLAKIGSNCLIMAGVVITSNAVIGDHVCILPNTVIHHDAVIGDYTLIGSNVSIAGSVEIQNNCYVGSGTRIINNVLIGKNSLIGLGSNVIRSVPDGSKVAGNPASQIK